MIASHSLLHPALRRLWWQSLLGWCRRVIAGLATPAGMVVGGGLFGVGFLLLQDSLAAKAPYLETVDQSGLLFFTGFLLILPFVFCSNIGTALSPEHRLLLNMPLPRKQILFFILIKYLFLVALSAAPVALLLDAKNFAELYLKLAGLGAFGITALMLLHHALAALPERVRRTLQVLSFVPIVSVLSWFTALFVLSYLGDEAKRNALASLTQVNFNRPFALFLSWYTSHGLARGAEVFAAFACAGGVLASALLYYFEPLPEPSLAGQVKAALAAPAPRRARPWPTFPYLNGAGPILRMQLSAELFSFGQMLQFATMFVVAQIGVIFLLTTQKSVSPTLLSFLIWLAAMYAFFGETSQKRLVFNQLEKIKALPIEPFPMLAANLVLPIFGAFILALVSLAPAFLFLPGAVLSLPLAKFIVALIPIVIFVAAFSQTMMLTVLQQTQRLSLAKRWYQEFAYLASMVLAIAIFLCILFFIVALTFSWAESSWATAGVVASVQLIGAALMFWYSRLSYRLLQVISHNS